MAIARRQQESVSKKLVCDVLGGIVPEEYIVTDL